MSFEALMLWFWTFQRQVNKAFTHNTIGKQICINVHSSNIVFTLLNGKALHFVTDSSNQNGFPFSLEIHIQNLNGYQKGSHSGNRTHRLF